MTCITADPITTLGLNKNATNVSSCSFDKKGLILVIFAKQHQHTFNEKKRSERHKHCAPKNFTPPQTPFPGTQDCRNLISWRWSLPAPTDRVRWRLMHAISSYRGNRHCPPIIRLPAKDRTDYNTLHRSKLARSVKMMHLFNFPYPSTFAYFICFFTVSHGSATLL